MIFNNLLYGSIMKNNKPPMIANGIVKLPGKYNNQSTSFSLDESILSKHSLMIGGTGCGKTTLFYHFMSQIKNKMTKDDVMIVFDSKGDFYSKFGKPGDLVIGNSPQYYQNSQRWNIYKEILADGWDKERYFLNAQEISKSFFKETKEKTSNVFYPNAAKDLFAAIICSFILSADEDDPPRGQSPSTEFFYNDELISYINQRTAEEMAGDLDCFDDFKSTLSYISDGTEQAQGVLSEMYSVVKELFVGIFAGHGMFSIRDFVRKKGGRTLFIEYDLSIGSVLTPIYSLLFDLALKEALGRQNSQGNVYLFCDEFKLLPRLEHIDDGVNFGRSLGVKIFAGLQSIEQLYEIYGHEKGRNIAAGFSSIYAFRANDTTTRKFVTKLFGKNILLEQYKTLDNKIVEEKRDGYTVEDWDMTELKVGEAVVGLPFEKPFKYYFDMYK